MGGAKATAGKEGESVKDFGKLLTKSGKLTIAALDHRGSLARALHPESSEQTTEAEMKEWKKRMIKRYRDMVSGILIDPVYGRELIDLRADCGWMVSLEKSGYRGGQEARVTELLPDWGVQETKKMGVGAVKLLLYYDPENVELAKKQKELAKRVGEDCKREGVVFLLEPLSYKVEGSREEEVLKIAEELSSLPVDVWKFEYPGTRAACEELSRVVQEPWVLLSAGMDYGRYREALAVACESGAAGMAVGRAVWQEFGRYRGIERERWLDTVAVERMRELVAVVEQHGKAVE